MPKNTFWKGHLKLSLVTAAVTLTPATTQSSKVRFNILNRQTGNRVESRYVDSVTHRPVADRNQVRGFPRSEDDFVLLEDDEIETVGLESTRAIDIQTFVPARSIDWLWYDKPHFLIPADKVGTEAYCVIRQAMTANDVVGISRLVLYRREHAVLLEPSGKGIILWTLRYGDSVREAPETLDMKTRQDKDVQATLKSFMEKDAMEWRPALVEDPIQKNIKKLIAKKEREHKKTSRPKAAHSKADARGGNVIDIMDALRKSLQDEKRK